MYTTPGIKKKSFGSKSYFQQFSNQSYNRRNNYGKKGGFSWHQFSWKGQPILLRVIIAFLGVPLLGGLLRFYIVILSDLPDIEDLKKINSLNQASVITDRNNKELYKIFEENRQYINIDKISPILQDAIVATEDQTFWSNAGVDFYGIAKAGVGCIISNSQCRGASTITQQLIKNLYLTNERSAERKLKEIVLALKLKNVLEKEVKRTTPGLTTTQLQEEVKKKVLELYLNYIFLGNNSYGVESASTNYFATSAQYLDILESSILAGIPQAPGRYNVYNNRDVVMGYLQVKDSITDEEVALDDNGKKELYLKATTIFADTSINGSDANAALEYLKETLSFDYSYGNGSYKVQYKLGRKDEVLARMYDTKFISDEELKSAVIEGFTYEFKKAKIGLVAPHFVFWIKELLETPNNKYLGTFNPDILYKGGLTITTSLDLEIQKMAEQAVKDNIKTINGYGAGNTALLHLDSNKGDILAYVGSADFNNIEIKGQNDMIRAQIQPGSTIKPLFYALGFMKLPLTLDTQIYDIKFAVGDYDPQNADGKFNGPMALRKALAYSRNIPAIKMYFAVGQQAEFIKFAQGMGVTSLKNENNYGPALAIGAGEMEILELANMYAHLSAQGKPAKIDPIVEIKAKDGTIIYKRNNEQQTQIIPSGVAYLIRKILSDPANLPSDWVNKFSFKGISFAHKTGTSNIRTKDGTRMPKDGWLAAYTPSKVTIFWAGNTTPKALNANAYGGWINNTTWKEFWGSLQKGGYLVNEVIPETEVKKITIAKNSGKLASESTPEAYRISTLAFINTAPTEIDNGVKKIKVDSLCYGKVSDLTPESDIVDGYISQVSSFMPNNMDLKDILTYVGANPGTSQNEGNQSYTLFSSEPEQVCAERQNNQGEETNGTGWDIGIGTKVSIVKPANNASVSNNFGLWYTANSKAIISSVEIIVNGKTFGTYQYNSPSVSDTKTISIAGAQAGTTHSITIKVTDAVGAVTERNISVKLQGADSRPPYILKPNTRITGSNGSYQVTLVFSDLESNVKGGSINIGGKKITSFEGTTASFTVSTLDPVSFTVSDVYNNSGEGTIDLAPYAPQ